jgi:glycosyltransferase involved in cell wall biosynthesis
LCNIRYIASEFKIFTSESIISSFLDRKHTKKVLFIVPYPTRIAPGQRFRFEQFLDAMTEEHIEVVIRPFIDINTYKILFAKGHLIEKSVAVILGNIRRIKHLLDALSSSYTFIYREATPLGPPWWEWVAKSIGIKIIYDFDDAIWLADDHEKKFTRYLKWKTKVGKLCKWSTVVTVGNAYLADYAQKYSQDVRIIPTVVNTTYHIPVTTESILPTIGWTGSHSTLPYLQEIIGVVRKLRESIAFRFLIIADKDPNYTDDFIEFRKWNITDEIKDLNEIDIGIMPLIDSKWAVGKCGFKLIQYLALEIPAVASDVGVNQAIIRDAGFICKTDEEWENALSKLLNNSDLRSEMGKKGRTYITENYSVEAITRDFLDLFD